MVTEVLLQLPLYVILFVMWWRFRHVIKIMIEVKSILNDDEFFGDTVDTPKEGVEQHRKRECLKGAISKGKAYLLRGKQKWTQGKVNKARDETINPLSVKFIKWSNTLKQIVGKLLTICLSVFDHFSGLALKGLTKHMLSISTVD